MNKKISTTLFLIVAAAAVAVAQVSSDKVRDVNAAGPFPLYITVQGAMGIGFKDIKDFSRMYSAHYPSNRNRTPWGVEVTAGFAVNEKNINNIYVEPVCYRNLGRSFRSKWAKFSYTNETSSLRVGFRGNIFYPITCHFQAGILYYRHIRIDVDSLNGNGKRPTPWRSFYINDVFSFRRVHIPGIEGKFRLNLLDPIGAAGGLGLFVEVYAVYYDNERTYYPGNVFAPGIVMSHGPSIDSFAMSLSAGAIIPLALRIKRFPLLHRVM